MTKKTITIKDQDLHAIIADLMDKALSIDRPNREKICKFVFNLVQNGGNKRVAAYDAGYGGEEDENGNKRSEKDRKSIASVEAARLLGNDRILAVYEELLTHKFLSKIFVKNLEKEHIISILYQAGMIALQTDRFKTGVSAMVEAGKLMGFYDEATKKDIGRENDEKDEMDKAPDLLRELITATEAKITGKEKLN